MRLVLKQSGDCRRRFPRTFIGGLLFLALFGVGLSACNSKQEEVADSPTATSGESTSEKSTSEESTSEKATSAIAPPEKASSQHADTAKTDDSLEQRLKSHVVMLAQTIGARSPTISPEGLERAADYITQVWTQAGFVVQQQTYEIDGLVLRNPWVEIPGKDPSLPIIVVGGHYDTAYTTPGADDNASGTALTLELAKSLKGVTLDRSVRLVAFTCEEPPYFATDDMGSLRYALWLKEQKVEVHRMISLESLGYFTDEPGSQKYPRLLANAYPNVGNFVAVVGRISDAVVVGNIAELMKKHSHLPIESAALPAALPGIDWSDHRSFWQIGVPGVMLTDTAIFRNPNYHENGDVPETLNYKIMAAIGEALPKVVADLAKK